MNYKPSSPNNHVDKNIWRPLVSNGKESFIEIKVIIDINMVPFPVISSMGRFSHLVLGTSSPTPGLFLVRYFLRRIQQGFPSSQCKRPEISHLSSVSHIQWPNLRFIIFILFNSFFFYILYSAYFVGQSSLRHLKPEQNHQFFKHISVQQKLS